MKTSEGRKESTSKIWRNVRFEDRLVKDIIPQECFMIEVVQEFGITRSFKERGYQEGHGPELNIVEAQASILHIMVECQELWLLQHIGV